ncbi:MAG: chorismate synthase [Candidatus Omnitrophica bacterium]|nr:chorismate synthase [Candidatus Omnitrophota bacterium]
MLRFLTAGESHGKCLTGILEGLPAGLAVNKREIDRELARRQSGYGRGMRMKVEKDKVEILSGLRKGRTIGSPLSLLIKNKDFKIDVLPAVTSPRPGHADLAGALKYNTKDVRDILERASARETAMRVAIGAICKAFLQEFKVGVISHVKGIGKVYAQIEKLSFNLIRLKSAKSCLNCADRSAEKEMIKEIDAAKKEGDSLGGTFELIAVNLPAGLGSCVHWDSRLDARLSGLLMSIPAIKGVEIGAGFFGSSLRGSEVHDAIFYKAGKGFFRKSNHAGGLEGGMTNGEPLVIRCAMKPIATLSKPLHSVNIKGKRSTKAIVERADVCAVPAASVVGENIVSFCLAQAMLEKFGGDSLTETKRNYQGYIAQVRKF